MKFTCVRRKIFVPHLQHVDSYLFVKFMIFVILVFIYGTTQTQVDGLARMQVLVLEYSRTNTHVEYASAWHEDDMMTHVMSSNQQVKSCDELKLVQTFFKCLKIFTWKESICTHKCFAHEHQLASEWYFKFYTQLSWFLLFLILMLHLLLLLCSD